MAATDVDRQIHRLVLIDRERESRRRGAIRLHRVACGLQRDDGVSRRRRIVGPRILWQCQDAAGSEERIVRFRHGEEFAVGIGKVIELPSGHDIGSVNLAHVLEMVLQLGRCQRGAMDVDLVDQSLEVHMAVRPPPQNQRTFSGDARPLDLRFASGCAVHEQAQG